MKYSKHVMRKKTLDDMQIEEEFGQITYSHTDIIKRTQPSQSLVTFRVHIDSDVVITALEQKGDDMLACILASVSLVGGLFTSLGAVASILVKRLTSADLATYIMQHIFLARREQSHESDPTNRMVSSHCADNYASLCESLSSRKVSNKDIKHLIQEILLRREPLSHLRKKRGFKLTQTFFTCFQLAKRCRKSHELSLIEQANRKFQKACDIRTVVKSITRANLVNSSLLNQPQRFLLLF